MGQRYLIDSNIIIDYTSGFLPPKASDFSEQIFRTDFITSVIIKIEVLGFNDASDKLIIIEELLDAAYTLPLDEDVIQQTILLRRKYKIKLGDAIIAATALIHGLTLVTRNTPDFKNIENLQIINPWDL